MGETAASSVRALRTGPEAITALARLPGGSELLGLARERPDVALVGGAVRDLLLGRRPRELDVTVPEGAAGLARAMAAALAEGRAPGAAAGEPTVHDRFGTASLGFAGGRLDVTELRAESYPGPGALPSVRAAGPAEDLARRDFSVNAISLALAGPRRGELSGVEGSLEDLAAGRIRVLHDGSFLEDPTRLLRLARYASRLGFEIEPHTLALARRAIAAGALGTISGARAGSELWLCASEDDAAGALGELSALGILGALGLPGSFQRPLAEAALGLLPADGSAAVTAMSVAFRPGAGEDPGARAAAARLMDCFEFTAAVREQVLCGAFDADALAAALQTPRRPSQLHAVLAGRPVEALAIAAALAAARSPGAEAPAREWFDHLRHVRLEIDGEDLLAAGVPQGPAIGARLARALALKLDGELPGGREQELRAALEAHA